MVKSRKLIKKDVPKIKQMKYIKQPNDFTCGPAAIYNLLIWGNYKITPNKTFRKIWKICECKLPFGTTYPNMNRAIREVIQNTNVYLSDLKMQPKLPDIKEHLDKGGIALLNFHWKNERTKETGEHYALLTENSPFGLHIINDGPNQSIREYYGNRQVKTLLQPYNFQKEGKFENLGYHDRIYPKVWLFEKSKN